MKDGYSHSFNFKVNVITDEEKERLKSVKSEIVNGFEYKIMDGKIYLIKEPTQYASYFCK